MRTAYRFALTALAAIFIAWAGAPTEAAAAKRGAYAAGDKASSSKDNPGKANRGKANRGKAWRGYKSARGGGKKRLYGSHRIRRYPGVVYYGAFYDAGRFGYWWCEKRPRYKRAKHSGHRSYNWARHAYAWRMRLCG